MHALIPCRPLPPSSQINCNLQAGRRFTLRVFRVPIIINNYQWVDAPFAASPYTPPPTHTHTHTTTTTTTTITTTIDKCIFDRCLTWITLSGATINLPNFTTNYIVAQLHEYTSAEHDSGYKYTYSELNGNIFVLNLVLHGSIWLARSGPVGCWEWP